MAIPLKGKKIVLGITGSIAAYTACYIIRGLIKRGAVFESIVPEAKGMTDEEAAALLRLALTSEPAREYLKKRAEGATS